MPYRTISTPDIPDLRELTCCTKCGRIPVLTAMAKRALEANPIIDCVPFIISTRDHVAYWAGESSSTRVASCGSRGGPFAPRAFCNCDLGWADVVLRAFKAEDCEEEVHILSN
jgi:hypothetical protein